MLTESNSEDSWCCISVDIISLSGDDSESNSKKPAAKAPAAKPAARKPAARKPAAKKPDAAAKKRKPAAKKSMLL